MNKEYDLMLDLETLGQGPGCVILSLAAVKFCIETGEIYKQIYIPVSLKDCIETFDFYIDPETKKWWNKQPKEIRDKAFNSLDKKTIIETFQILKYFIDQGKLRTVWSNGATFDIPIINYIIREFKRTNMYWDVFWNRKQERCVRTYDSIFPEIKEKQIKKNKHDPIQDCYYQIERVSEIYNILKHENKTSNSNSKRS